MKASAKPSVPLPPRTLKSQVLPIVEVPVARLFRVSRHTAGEPFHGRAGTNRFDDRARVKRNRFGTCYLGLSLEVAIAETVLHDLMPVRGRFKVAATELASRQVVRFKGETLKLVDLTGASLKALVGSSHISTITPYDIPQKWAAALHAHPANVDGILFMSRQLNDQKAVVVFSRAGHKLKSPTYTPLLQVKGALGAITTLRISVAYD